MSRKTIKWLFLSVMICTVPVLFFLGAAGGFVPFIVVAGITIAMLFSIFKSGLAGGLGILPLCLMNFVIYGAILYFLASLLARFVSLLTGSDKAAIIIMCVLLLLLLLFLPIYGVSDVQGGSSTGSNIFGLIRSLCLF